MMAFFFFFFCGHHVHFKSTEPCKPEGRRAVTMNDFILSDQLKNDITMRAEKFIKFKSMRWNAIFKSKDGNLKNRRHFVLSIAMIILDVCLYILFIELEGVAIS